MDVASFGAALLAVSLIAQQPLVGLARPSGLGTLVDGFRCMRGRQAIQAACTSRHSGSSGQRRSRWSAVGTRSVSQVIVPYPPQVLRRGEHLPYHPQLEPGASRRTWNSRPHTGRSPARSSPHRSGSQLTPRRSMYSVTSSSSVVTR